ncbi:MAG: polysaccharide pyruvyl transferase family protein [Desulfitobacterium sp.]
MKIGIMTFHRALNYGALLQAYALQETMLSLGAECEIIDYRNPLMEDLYRVKSYRECSGIKECISCLLHASSEKRTHEAYEKFRRDYLILSPKVYLDNKDLSSCNNEYDRIICGSDQVWNYRALNFDKNYFLDFITDRDMKYSYAASFGVDTIPEEYYEEYRRRLLHFSHLSVRESQGCELVYAICGLRPEQHIDPVLLLSREMWAEKMGCTPPHEDDYILVYSFELTDTMKKFINDLARRTGSKVLVFGRSFKKILNTPYENIHSISPREFVRCFFNARYVVTNSFHGTAFSILFNKEFYTELLVSSNLVNSRLENILKVMNLEDRKITETYEEDHLLASRVKWDEVNEIVSAERRKALHYLKSLAQISPGGTATIGRVL